jgi:hypothetical protein
MTTTTLTKTAAQALLAHTAQATASVTVGSAVDVSTKVGPATAFVKMGRTTTTACGAQLAFRLEGSAKTSGNDEWVPIYEWTSANATTTCNASTVATTNITAGDTSFTIAASTGITGGDLLYLRNATTANSEWVRVKSVSGTTITLEEGTTRSHVITTTTTQDFAEMWAIPIDIAGHVRVRLVVNSNNVTATGQTVDVIAWLVTADSASTA